QRPPSHILQRGIPHEHRCHDVETAALRGPDLSDQDVRVNEIDGISRSPVRRYRRIQAPAVDLLQRPLVIPLAILFQINENFPGLRLLSRCERLPRRLVEPLRLLVPESAGGAQSTFLNPLRCCGRRNGENDACKERKPETGNANPSVSHSEPPCLFDPAGSGLATPRPRRESACKSLKMRDVLLRCQALAFHFRTLTATHAFQKWTGPVVAVRVSQGLARTALLRSVGGWDFVGASRLSESRTSSVAVRTGRCSRHLHSRSAGSTCSCSN